MRTLMLAFLLWLPVAALAEANSLSRDQLKARQAQGVNTVLVDVRSAAEFAAGHIAGAINIPHDQLPARAGELEAHKSDGSLVLYCRSGRRTRLAVETLEGLGFTDLNHLAGDIQAWVAAGEPVVPCTAC